MLHTVRSRFSSPRLTEPSPAGTLVRFRRHEAEDIRSERGRALPSRLLLVEPHEDLRALLALALRERGVDVLALGSYSDAARVEVPCSARPALLVDWQEARERIVALAAFANLTHTKTIIATTADEVCLPRGLAVLWKPFEMRRVFDALATPEAMA